MKILVLMIHCGESMRAGYHDTLRKMVPGHTCHLAIVNSPYGGLSSAYRRLGAELEGKGNVLSEAARYARAPLPLEQYDVVAVASYSAGYKLTERILSDRAAAEMVDGLVWIDSGHAALDADGTASDVQLAPVVRHALRSKETDRVCWISHTDVRTHGYASTTQVADEVKRLCGLPAQGGDAMTVGPVVGRSVASGGLRILSVDAERSAKTEHAKALTAWGDEWLGGAVAALMARIEEVDSKGPREALITIPDITIGERALAIALNEKGVREIPGGQHAPRILEYLRGCMRGGVRIGGALRTDETPWCAAAASWCLEQAAIENEPRPHQYRAAVREIWEDAIASGTAVGASRVRQGEYMPRTGDLAILTRGGPVAGEGAAAFAKTGGKGHVGRVMMYVIDGNFQTWDGNVNDTWTQVDRHLSDSNLVGFVAHPYATETLSTSMATEAEIDGLRQIDAARIESAIRRFNRNVEDFIREIKAAAS